MALPLTPLSLPPSLYPPPLGLLSRLEDEAKMNTYLSQDKLPQALGEREKTFADLQRVLEQPSMTRNDLDDLHRRIQELTAEINKLIEKRMVSSNPADDKLALFKQQVGKGQGGCGGAGMAKVSDVGQANFFHFWGVGFVVVGDTHCPEEAGCGRYAQGKRRRGLHWQEHFRHSFPSSLPTIQSPSCPDARV